MPDLSKKYLFRMTHIQNIPHILKHGITHISSVNANPQYVPIGDGNLITTRNDFILRNGIPLGKYIPFYFGSRTPMLYVVQNGYNMVTPTSAQNIVYCVSTIQEIMNLNLDFIFTDGHAVDSFSTQYLPLDINEIDNILDWNSIKARYWKDENDLDMKRRKEAEFLVLGDISTIAVLGFIVYNETAKKSLISFGADETTVLIKSDYYF